MNILKIFILLFLATQTRVIALTFDFNYLDSAGTGFYDTTLGSARRDALQSAGGMLSPYFSTYNATVSIDVTSTSDSSSNTLASAGSGLTSLNDGFHYSNVQNYILTGEGSSDASMNWNFFHDWSYTDTVGSLQMDFKSTAMHEILHTMGFLGGISSLGTGGNQNTSGTPDAWFTFDKFLTNSTGVDFIDPSTFSFNTAIASDLIGDNIGIFFNGANAVAQNSGNRVSIYSPSSWEDGSSGSHTDGDVYSSLLMNPGTAEGLSTRTLSAIELGILKDIGYTSIVVPEPSTILLFALGALFLLRVYFKKFFAMS